MSDQMDSGDALQEPLDSQPNSSGEQTDSQTHSLAAAELVDQILQDPAATEKLRRLFQSEKDRGVAKAVAQSEQAISEIQRIAAKLGVDPAVAQQAERELVMEQMAEEYRAGRLQPVQEPVSRDLTSSEARAKASSVLGGVSPEIREAVLQEVGNQAFESADAVTNFVISKVATQASKPVATQANTATIQGSTPVPTSMKALLEARDKLLNDREFTTPAGRQKLKEIARQMEEIEKSGS